MRNHGLSPRSPEMTLPRLLAQDLLDTLDAHQIERATFIGHSMGGKAVMALTALAPETHQRSGGDRYPRRWIITFAAMMRFFAAIRAVSESAASTRQQAAQVMREHLQEEGVIQFLLKSFVDGDWRFNVPVLWDQYPHIVGWETIPAWPHPTQFIPAATRPM